MESMSFYENSFDMINKSSNIFHIVHCVLYKLSNPYNDMEEDKIPFTKCMQNSTLLNEYRLDDMLNDATTDSDISLNVSSRSSSVSSTSRESYSLKPLKVKCLQAPKDLQLTCDRLGLKLCCSDINLNLDALRNNHFLRKCSVRGLYPYESLNRLCKKYNLQATFGSAEKENLNHLCKNYNLHATFNNVGNGDLKHKVDLIINHKFVNDTKFYLVKWKRLPLKRNRWISEKYLLPIYNNLVTYYNYTTHLNSQTNQEIIQFFYNDLVNRKPQDYLVLVKLSALLFKTTENLCFSFSELKKKCMTILTMPVNKLNRIQSELFDLMQFRERRKQVLVNLNEWERDINNFNPATYIEVENNVDLEMAPTNFQFIHDYVRNHDSPEEPICFCECLDCYENKKACCPHHSDGAFAYSKNGRLKLLRGYPIYECNKLCKCDENCTNRVVQHGQKVKVAIFRTTNGCGWGLKTLEVIEKDQFVLEYLGEIITSEEAEARGEIYDFIRRTYLFDLNYGEGNCLYTVDAGHMGNAGHFINHSCNPNLHVFAVWINQQDPNLPRLAFFSKRKINQGEELTFDYKMVKNKDRFNVASSPPIGVECKCNSQKCRKYLF